MANRNFFGYGALEDWAASINRTAPVYACGITDPSPTDKYGMSKDRLVILCSQPDERGDVHYCRLPIGSITRLGGADFGDGAGETRAMSKQAWELVKAWLIEGGFQVREAVIAMPKTLKFMDGWAKFLKWDKEQKRFYRADLEPNGPQAPVGIVEAFLKA